MNNKGQLGKLIIFLALFLFFLPLISANSDWVQWGNIGAVYSQGTSLNQVAFGSNYPQGNLDFTNNKTITTTNIAQPIIYDLDQNGQNNIITFSTSSVRFYNNEGVIDNSVSLGSDIQGIGTIAIKDGLIVLVVLSLDDDGSYLLNIINSDFLLEEQINLTSDYTFKGSVLGGLSMTETNKIFLVDNSGHVYSYDLNTETFFEFEPTTDYSVNDYSSYILKGGISSIRDLSTQDTYIAFGINGNKIRIYNVDENNYCDGSGITSVVTGVSSGIIGSVDSSPHFILAQWNTASSGHWYQIYDTECNLKSSFSTSFWGGRTKPQHCIADVNHDGNNEFCFFNSSVFTCLDSDFESIMKYNYTLNDDMFYFACAEYDNSNDFHELITSDGIYEFGSEGNMTELIDLGFTGENGMFLTTSIYNQAEFIKDLMFVTDTKLVYFISSGTPSVCGDGECTSGETIFNCEEDCFIFYNETITLNDSLGSFGYMQECSQDSDCIGDLVCINNMCSGKDSGESCTYDFECKSDICNEYGFCTAQDKIDTFKDFFVLTGFNSTGSQLFLALVMIFVGTIGGASIGAVAGTIGGIVGAVIGLILSMMFTILILGWIGIWLLFIIIMLSIITIFLTIALSR